MMKRRRSSCRLRCGLLLLQLLFMLNACNAMKGQISITTTQNFLTFGQFCFEDGSLQIDVQARCETCSDIHLLICSETEYYSIYTASDLCSMPANSLCEKVYAPVGGQITAESKRMNGRKVFAMLMCSQANKQITAGILINYEYLNSFGQLSCEYRNYSQVYLCLTIVWVVTSILWVFTWVVRRDINVTLQKCLTCVPLMQAVNMAITRQFWEEVKESGEVVQWLNILRFVSRSVFKGVMLAALLTLAKGLMVVRWETSITEVRTILFSLCWLIIATFTFNLFQGLFLFLWVFIFIIVLRIIFASIAQNYQALLSRLMHLEAENRRETEYYIMRELIKVYAFLRTSFVTYLFAQVLLQIIATFMLSYDKQFIYPTAAEVADWTLIVAVGWMFRSRKVPVVNNVEQTESQEPDKKIFLVVLPHENVKKDDMLECIAIALRARRPWSNNTQFSDAEEVGVAGQVEERSEVYELLPGEASGLTEEGRASEQEGQQEEIRVTRTSTARRLSKAVGVQLDYIVQPVVPDQANDQTATHEITLRIEDGSEVEVQGYYY